MNIIEKIDLLLLEANKVETPLSDAEAEKIIETKCSKNFKEGPILFRGNRAISGNYYLFTGKESRISANGSNHYTVLFSKLLKSWSNYPKRDHSLICSTDTYKAKGYGNLYQVIPFDSSGPFGVAGSDDFGDILTDNKYFKPTKRNNLPRFNDLLAQFGFDDEFDKAIKTKKMKQVIEDVGPNEKREFAFYTGLYAGKSASEARDLSADYDNIPDNIANVTFLDILEKFADPKNTSVYLISNFSSLKNTESEVGFDTPAIMKRVD